MRDQGALEAVLARCSHVMTNAEGGRPVLLSEAARAAVLQRVDDFGRRQALRCLALACRTMPAEHRQVCSGAGGSGLTEPQLKMPGNSVCDWRAWYMLKSMRVMIHVSCVRELRAGPCSSALRHPVVSFPARLTPPLQSP